MKFVARGRKCFGARRAIYPTLPSELASGRGGSASEGRGGDALPTCVNPGLFRPRKTAALIDVARSAEESRSFVTQGVVTVRFTHSHFALG